MLALLTAVPVALPLATSASAKTVAQRVGDDRGDVTAPIDIKMARIWYSSETELRVNVKFNTLDLTALDSLSLTLDVDGDVNDDSVASITGAGETSFTGEACEVGSRIRTKAKTITLRVPATCFGSPKVIEVLKVAATSGEDVDTVRDALVRTR